ncbi:MAG: endopeptidase La [Deltaproteobacteria bacterium]|nr:endopeptidase La [Deltaproteobacteria bacterium]
MSDFDENDEIITKTSETSSQALEIPEQLPMLPVRDVVVFPYMILPLFVGREKSIAAVDDALQGNRMLFLTTQKEVATEDPGPDDIYETGTVAMIMRMLKLPDGRVKILVQGLSRARRREILAESPCLTARLAVVEEEQGGKADYEAEALMRSVREKLEEIINMGKGISTEVMMILENVEDPGRLADIVAANLNLKVADAMQVLETTAAKDRIVKVHALIERELQVLMVQAKIKSAAKEEMNKSQREYYLRQQMKAIQEELGVTDERTEEYVSLLEKVKKARMPKEARAEAERELNRLKDMPPSSAEASVIRTYIDWLTDLPWKKVTQDNLDLIRAKKILDDDHFDLEKIKERILEHLAVRKLKPEAKGPILCFVGPPGVGKTSLGHSIARAMDRKFVRLSLGGVKDEAEIRGHRRTYVGAMPGRIVQGIRKAGARNPVFMLDEVDKIGQDFRGDPSSALLEVLDPAQNSTFEDHYLNVPFDLSKVMFVCTANFVDPIPAALLDRMELIRLSGYSREEKLHIAKKYLIPRQREEQGISEKHIEISDDALGLLIDQYTRESGMRNTEREIANLCRKVARRVAEGRTDRQRITKRNLARYLGAPRYLPEAEVEVDQIGVSTGLAWTQVGGEILHVEVTTTKGAPRLILTGQLGDVMKESAQAALSYARSKALEFGAPEDFFEQREIHLHVPAGAIPKDGPSAGITMATALVSLMTGRPVDHTVGMTGEITLRGRVLPIGGLKEKSLAAMQAGLKTVILPERNRKDIEELPPKVRKTVSFRFVTTMDEVIGIALKPKPDGKPEAQGAGAQRPASEAGVEQAAAP